MSRRKDMRSSAEIEANSLDMEIFRLADRMERFAAEWAEGNGGIEIAADARALRAARYAVRRLMHPDDRETTK